MGSKKILRSIYMTEEQIEAIKRLSKKTHVPQSVYIRQAIDLLLEKYSDQLSLDLPEKKDRAIK